MPPLALIRISLLLVTTLLCSCREEAAIEAKINRIATNVEGFDLVFDDSAAKAEFGLFEIGYAIKANYSYFTYRDKLYQSVGGGSVLIRPIKDSPAGFIVRETAQSKDEGGRVKEATLQILDKNSGEELARRSLVAHAVEDSTGWTGDHAMGFVRKVLSSGPPPRRSWGVSDYEQAMAKIELVKPTNSTPYPRNVTPRNCPNTLRIERHPYNSTLAGANFEFLPRNPLQFVACDSGRVLVASGVYSSDLSLDLLTIDGKHIAQGYVRLPLPVGADGFDMPEVTLAAEKIKAVLLVNSRLDWQSPFTAFAQVQVSATLLCHKPDCTSRGPR